MKRKMLSIVLTLCVFAAVVPLTTSPAFAVENPSFEVKFEEKLYGDAGVVLFSERPAHTLKDLEGYGFKNTYVFPVGTKVAHRIGNSLNPISASGGQVYIYDIRSMIILPRLFSLL